MRTSQTQHLASKLLLVCADLRHCILYYVVPFANFRANVVTEVVLPGFPKCVIILRGCPLLRAVIIVTIVPHRRNGEEEEEEMLRQAGREFKI
jgi:hypothetical protein